MSVFKCKMCGGDLELFEGVSVAVCEYCGTKQTVPKTEDEKKANLFNRANRLRFGNEFDRAAGIYESIIAEFPEEAEAYWGLVLCKYGIEYVDDPTTANKIPTCHRTSFESIFSDPNYLQSVKLADPTAKALYEKEAAEIDRLQQKILNIVNREKPFDVFICYKETDANGNRTTDSVLAQDIYDHLTEKGFNVFFARITLEDKLGQEYEPYIFAALNSAKVMLVVGTSYENFTAVWVKNEWNRFLALSKTKTEKVLIPVYKDIDAYDLPEEFKNLQAQDMAKIGFTQDLIRGIKKIAQNEEPKPTVVKETVVTAENTNIAPLLKRAFMFLEDGEWDRADDFCEQVLNIDPECAEAYLGKLMAEIRVRKQEELKDLTEPFDNSNNYQKAVRFADEKLKTALISYIEHINTRNENARLDGIYTRAKNAMSAANTESAYKEAAALFESVSEYQDSAALAQSCYEKAEEEKKKAEEEKKKCDELYKEYKAAVQNEKTGAVKKAEANKEIASLKIAYNNLNNLKNSWQGIEDELFSVNERLNSIKAEIVSLTNEKAKLGLFAGKRKKEIAERIAMLENNRESLIGDIASLQKKKLGYNTLSEVESKTNRITQQIEEQNKIIEELSSARSSHSTSSLPFEVLLSGSYAPKVIYFPTLIFWR